MPKITIVGGGSYTWGPLFIRDILVTPELQGSQVVLYDIDPQPLELVHALGQKVIQEYDLAYTLEKTLHIEEALQGSDFVILTITTGGLEAMRQDLEIPARYGIYQTVGDTVGPGGLARALRNIPVVVDLARQMERLCPQAWLLNYTNPMTTLCRAVTRETRIKTIGLCHEFLGVKRVLGALFSAGDTEIEARVGGINHLIWILELSVRGQDAFAQLPALADRILTRRGQLPGIHYNETSSLVDRFMVKARLFQVYGALPAAGDRHIAEFFPHFLSEATDRGRQYGLALTSVEERYRWRAEARHFVQAALADQVDLQPFLKEASGEAAHRIVTAIAKQGRYFGIMNLPNRGQIGNLPKGAVVETFGLVDPSGVHPLTLGDLPPGVHQVTSCHVNNQEMIVPAALEGDRSLALQALVNDPLVRDLEGAVKMLDEMLEANRQYIPQFFK